MQDKTHTLEQWIGFDRTVPVAHITYDRVYEIIISLEGRARELNPDMIVGIMRGGIVPATMLAQRLSYPLSFVMYHRGADSPEWQSSNIPTGKRILLVDDIVSSGQTLKIVKAYLENLGNVVNTLTLFHDPVRSSFIPDVSIPADKYIMFPWETKDTTPSSREKFGKQGYVLPSDEQDFYAVDLDGVIAPDIRKSIYNKRLDVALAMRDRLPVLSSAPSMPNMVIVTGRMLVDYDKTRIWLDDNGYKGIELVCRDPDQYPTSSQGVAAHKADAATRLGASVMIESDLAQAMLIAEHCPTMTVVWWGKKRMIRLGGVNEYTLP